MKTTVQVLAFASMLSVALSECNFELCSFGSVGEFDDKECKGRIHRVGKNPRGQPGVEQGNPGDAHWDWEVETTYYKINIWDSGLVTYDFGEGNACVMQIAKGNDKYDVLLPSTNARNPNWNGPGCCLDASLIYGITDVFVWN
ncbi:hypothetical protein COCCADRAFT_39930 [Bipolaris zeicola 26-R-13]|uniref:Ecp2 effector protein domain-containing protein n=1 Tax=Cochliobolus carbonum (strain 26-R-13) TaxID=930089 RepID=W6XX00_COCC2|nr:uncharacterized protein COCCADRAFT_39930 [Bipolaris zeicola 26-R-13]EUC29750.1 hypothetical protein COCCADRAFT_39930 [Bipolaris zeicola 26-R-13]